MYKSDAYLESQVYSAGPAELVAMLYRGAIDAIQCARRHLADGEVSGRTRRTAQAAAIIGELSQALDDQRGGKLAQDLRELYDYSLRRIHEGNFRQSDGPLADAERVLMTLLEGWIESSSQASADGVAYEPLCQSF